MKVTGRDREEEWSGRVNGDGFGEECGPWVFRKEGVGEEASGEGLGSAGVGFGGARKGVKESERYIWASKELGTRVQGSRYRGGGDGMEGRV